MAGRVIDVDTVNALNFEQFVERFGNVIEHCPVIAAGVWSVRPFKNLDDIKKAFWKTIDDLPFHVKEGTLRCHPDLAGKLASSGGLTVESVKEQQSAGLLNITDEERQHLSGMNARYKSKFNFPFIICVRENKKEAIMKEIERRLENDLEKEVAVGIGEVQKIGYLRLCDLVDINSTAKL